MKRQKKTQNQGFTIIELMIALSVLSVLLLTSTVILIQISRWYSKGVNAANLQNVSRNITSDVTSALQFSGVSPTPAVATTATDGTIINRICLGKIRYSYVLNRKLGTDQVLPPNVSRLTNNHVLWRDVMSSAAACNYLDITGAGAVPNTDGYEMVGSNMRLTSFSLTETPAGSGIYTLALSLAYGDSDLMTLNGAQTICKGGPGSDFCSLSSQTSTVTRRIK